MAICATLKVVGQTLPKVVAALFNLETPRVASARGLVFDGKTYFHHLLIVLSCDTTPSAYCV